ncbi:MAG TPA: tetratricopeptide repeat protein, partial [Nitrospira sp.]|nr:tetratricopeptide repeat protein [Nitrospira sp.]
MIRSRLLLVLLVLGWSTMSRISSAYPEPYRPTDEAQVLERLSFKATDSAAREIESLRADLRNNPRHLESAVKLATRYIERGRSEGDPRFLGHAQAILTPWWNEPIPPVSTLLLRATIRQNAHEFDQALGDLDQVLDRQPTNAQAWLTKASILQVQARYDEARRACQRLVRLAASHVLSGCLSDIAGLTGQSTKSRDLLRQVLSESAVSGRERIWLATILAETAARTGAMREAEQYFAEAFKVGIKDQYLLSAYADYLLDQRHYQDTISLLRSETRTDGLLLRLTLAEQALELPLSQNHTAELAARFAAGRERGTTVHIREEARFTLALLHDAGRALPLAQANWSVQREPADARILLECALADKNRAAARPVLDWLNSNHVEDFRLRQLARQIQ